MFYCNECADKSRYPKFPKEFQSWGRCETCRETTGCNDLPSNILDGIDERRVTAREVEQAIASIMKVAE